MELCLPVCRYADPLGFSARTPFYSNRRMSLLLPGICPSTTNDSPDVMASAAADPADVEADLGSGSGVRCDTGVKWYRRLVVPRAS